MKKIEINKHLCVHCGSCIAACPAHLFWRESVNDCPQPTENVEERCISCNHCVAVCPVSAITASGISGEMCMSINKASFPRFEHIATLVRVRRSIRRYLDKPLTDQTLQQLLDVLRWAPTARNTLSVKWLVINNKATIRELAALVIRWIAQQPGGEEAEKIWNKGTDLVFRGAPCLVAAYTDADASWAPIDTAIAVETLDLCAAAMRLGSCWAGYFIRAAQNEPAINEFLGLQNGETIHGGLMLGYIGEESYQKIPHRPELQIRWIP